MLYKLRLGRFFFQWGQWGRARHIHLHIHIVKATKWRSRQAISSINSTCPRQEKCARNQFWKSFWKVQVNLVPRFSLLSLSCSRVVGLSLVGPDHMATRFLGCKNICWKGGVAEFLQCQCEKYTVSGWEDCCHFPTGVFALMETFRQIFILRIV